MKVTLDLDQLLAEGKITAEEYERLRGLAGGDVMKLGFRIILVFGCLAVLAGLFLAVMVYTPPETLAAIAAMLAPVGAFLFATPQGLGLAAAGLAALGLWFNSGFAMSLSALTLFFLLGSDTGYGHATYTVWVREPLLTVAVFTLLGAAYLVSAKRIPLRFERPVTIFARNCLFYANVGFMVGSLWGNSGENGGIEIPDVAFALAWALALLAGAVVAVRLHRRAMLNMIAVFAGIHFYTQWFENLGANPLSLLAAGVALLLLTWLLRTANRRMEASPKPLPG